MRFFIILTVLVSLWRVGWSAEADRSKVGYRFTEVVSGSIYERMGLQAGDVLLKVNGKPVHGDTPADVMKAFRGHEKLTLQIRRQGKIETLRYSLR